MNSSEIKLKLTLNAQYLPYNLTSPRLTSLYLPSLLIQLCDLKGAHFRTSKISLTMRYLSYLFTSSSPLKQLSREITKYLSICTFGRPYQFQSLSLSLSHPGSRQGRYSCSKRRMTYEYEASARGFGAAGAFT